MTIGFFTFCEDGGAMGIADDIKPRKTHHSNIGRTRNESVFHIAEKTEKEQPQNSEQKENQDKMGQKENEPESVEQKTQANQSVANNKSNPKELLEDQFFNKKEIATNHQNQTGNTAKPKPRNNLKKVFFVLLFIGVIGAGAYQAYQKSSLWHKTTTANSVNQAKTSSEDKYTGEVITQDYTASDQSSSAVTSEGSTGQVASTEPPAAVETPAIDKSKITLKLLNGNGIRNSAASVKTILETAGFSVPTPTNAKNFSYQQTYVYYHTGKEAEANLVKDALTGRDVVLELSDTITSTTDLVVVVGKK